MSELKNKLVMIALTQDEARIWAAGLDKNSIPEKIYAPAEKGSHHHVRQTQHQGGHSGDPKEWGYFDVLAKEVSAATEILLIGHGEGKANAMLRFVQFIERNNPQVARKVIGAVDTNLNALSENELLAITRNWFESYHKRGIRSAAASG